MCGILAVYRKSGLTRSDIDSALTAIRKVAHRGPDGEGVVAINTRTLSVQTILTDETPKGIVARHAMSGIRSAGYQELSADLLLGHRRLSIIDVSENGHQPMSDCNGNYLIYNGEIYNYLELRSELTQQGVTFETSSDSEVVLKAYRHWGVDCFRRFNGMWAIVIWHAETRQLLVSNDRFGVKPLFYFCDDGFLVLASEQKQIRCFGNIRRTLNRPQIDNYLRYGELLTTEQTFNNEVRRFSPGTYCSIETRATGIAMNGTRFYTRQPNREVKRISLIDAREEFDFLLADAVKLRMRSDVNYGFAVSGGLDSSTILYSAYGFHTGQLACFSAVFPGQPGDESKYIARAVSNLSVRHFTTCPLDYFSMDEFRRHIYHQDFPVQSTSYFAEFALARLVNESGYKVLLVGQGADELFGGYTAYFYEYGVQLLGRVKLIKLLREVKGFAEIRGLTVRSVLRTIYGIFKQAVKEKTIGNANYSERQRRIASCKSLNELFALDLNSYTIPIYLHSDDADGMAFSIESRHPFLDYRLVDFAYSLPDAFKIHRGWLKRLMRESRVQLPADIRWRRDKMGYTTPHAQWIDKYSAEFKSYAELAENRLGNIPGELFRKGCLGIWLTNQN